MKSKIAQAREIIFFFFNYVRFQREEITGDLMDASPLKGAARRVYVVKWPSKMNTRWKLFMDSNWLLFYLMKSLSLSLCHLIKWFI